MVRPAECDWGGTGCWGNTQGFGGYNPNIYNPQGQFYQGGGGGGNGGSGSNSNVHVLSLNNLIGGIKDNGQVQQQPLDHNNAQSNILDNFMQYIKDNPMFALGVVGLTVAIFKK